MLKKLQLLPEEQALIAHSGVQFLDYGFRVDPEFTFSRFFLETVEERPDSTYTILLPIEPNRQKSTDPDNPSPEFINSESRHPVTSKSIYSVQLAVALDAYNGIWLPVPFLKRKGRDQAGRELFERGPTNWARLRVVKLDTPDDHGNTHR